MGRISTVLSVNQKLEIIKHVKNKARTRRELATDHNCNVSTINRILKTEENIRKIALKNPKRKRSRTSIYQNVDNALTDWFNKARMQNIKINGPILLNKAQEFAIGLKSDFKPSSGWLWRWQKRENVKFKRIYNNSSELSDEDTDKVLVENQNFIPEEEPKAGERDVFYKLSLTACKKANVKLVSDDEVREALTVLRRYMLQGNLALDALDRVEEKIIAFIQSKEAQTHDEVWPSSLCQLTYGE